MIWEGGSIIDAPIISAVTSTKNSSKSRDTEKKQTKKGNERYLGMKAHIGTDAGTVMIHRASFTGANTHDIAEAGKLVRLSDEFVNADAGYYPTMKVIR